MKKPVALLCAAALMLSLAACGDFAPDPTDSPDMALDFEYTASTFPDFAASRAYEPLAGAVTAIMLGTSRADAAEHYTLCSSAEAARIAADGGVALVPQYADIPSGVDSAPVARDALVFFTGEGSGVESLSSAELRNIFTGREGSWSAFGGDGAIQILTRPEGSGSIAALEELVGCDEALVTGEGAPLTGGAAIGFGLWSECVLMGLADGYSIIAVDGVEPTEENIASGEYALGLDTLALVSSSAAADSGERALWLWLQGGVGQAFISSQGYMEAVR